VPDQRAHAEGPADVEALEVRTAAAGLAVIALTGCGGSSKASAYARENTALLARVPRVTPADVEDLVTET